MISEGSGRAEFGQLRSKLKSVFASKRNAKIISALVCIVSVRKDFMIPTTDCDYG